ncbi:MAG: response regulator transcription factor [Tepidisphaeraceae bacterium]
MSISIVLADDHVMFRQGLRQLLGRDATFRVVGEAGDGATAVRRTAELAPDVVITDIRMPDVDGVEVARRIVTESPRTKVIGLTGYFDRNLVEALLRAGATGYVLKSAAVEELGRAIHSVMRGETFFGTPTPNDAPAAPSPVLMRALSPREEQVLRLIADGMSTKQTARQLSVSVKTVETHRRNLMEKLGIDNVAELTKYALRQGLSTL